MKKLLVIATAAGLMAGTAAFAQTTVVEQDKNKSQQNMQMKMNQSGQSGTTGANVGSSNTPSSQGTTGMKNDGASVDSKKEGAPKKASEQGQN